MSIAKSEAAVAGSVHPFVYPLTMMLSFYGRPRLLLHVPGLWPIPHSSPVRQSLHSQPQYSSWVCPLKLVSSSSPPHISRHVSQAGECSKVAQTTCSGLCSALCKSVVLPSSKPLKLPFSSGWSYWQWGGFPRCGNLSSFTVPFWGRGPVLLPFFFFFVLPNYVEIFLALFRCLRSYGSVQ